MAIAVQSSQEAEYCYEDYEAYQDYDSDDEFEEDSVPSKSSSRTPHKKV